MNKYLLAGIILSIVVIISIGSIVILAKNDTITSYEQTGKLTFYTENDYSQFKIVLANPEIKIESMESLSSSPPIIVQYDIIYPSDIVFNYDGIKNKYASVNMWWVFLAGFIAGVSFIVAVVMFDTAYDNREEQR